MSAGTTMVKKILYTLAGLAGLIVAGVLFIMFRTGGDDTGPPPSVTAVSYTHLTLPTILLV